MEKKYDIEKTLFDFLIRMPCRFHQANKKISVIYTLSGQLANTQGRLLNRKKIVCC